MMLNRVTTRHNRHGQHTRCSRGHRLEMRYGSGWYGWCGTCHHAETCRCTFWRAPYSSLRRLAWELKVRYG